MKSVIVGRSAEKSRINRLVADAKDGRSRSLVLRGEAGKSLAVERCGPYDRARTGLVFGEWLRRHRHPTAAKEQLVEAYEAFDRIGAHGWLPRVRTELTALGETSPGSEAAGPAGVLTTRSCRWCDVRPWA